MALNEEGEPEDQPAKVCGFALPGRPYESGEVTVQSYNTALSLSHAAEHSDGVVLVENEVLHRTCQALLGIRSPSFQVLSATVWCCRRPARAPEALVI